MPPHRRLCASALLAWAFALGGCATEEDEAGSQNVVTATTTHVADLAERVAGERAEVRGLLRPGADPHDHEVRPSEVRAIAGSRVVFRSGGDVDGWLDAATESAGGNAREVELLAAVRAIRDPDGGTDPHWWQDPRNAVRAVQEIRDALTRADPRGASVYRRNARALQAELRQLDRAVAACVASVPPRRRRIVTSHDSLGYFAARYDVDVVGAVIPAQTTRGQASAGETAALIRRIRAEGVRTIFPESSVSAELEEAIARDSGAAVGPALWTDSLGPPGSSGSSYTRALAANTRALVSGFGGDGASCRLPAR